MTINVIEKDSGRFLLNESYKDILVFNGIEKADDLWNIPSESVKSKLKERGTSKAFLKIPNSEEALEIYIKRYSPLPIKEYFKAAFSLKPIFLDGALHEWKAILKFLENGIRTPEPIAVAKTSKGTCIVLLGIRNYVRASDLFAKFAKEKDWKSKRKLIEQIALIAGRMHSANFAHQDFYLLHFFAQIEEKKLFIIDLQRVIMQKSLARRWRVKDIAQLDFSAKGFVSKTDKLRFWKKYCEICGTDVKDFRLLQAIKKKSAKLAKNAKER